MVMDGSLTGFLLSLHLSGAEQGTLMFWHFNEDSTIIVPMTKVEIVLTLSVYRIFTDTLLYIADT